MISLDLRKLHRSTWLWILPMPALLMGVGTCQRPDNDGDGWTTSQGDCNDADPQIHPEAAELCDGIDNDCDGQIDDGLTFTTWYVDQDGDGYGDPASAQTTCSQPPGSVLAGGDCNDIDSQIHPEAAELCDGIDNNCNGQIDDGLSLTPQNLDLDGDGFGAEINACVGLRAPVAARGDCDDSDPGVYPGALDTAGDGIDQDCGGFDGQQPSVGLDASSYTTIQAALDASSLGDVVWVGPGTYLEHDITFPTYPMSLISTHQTEATVVDAQGLGRVMVFSSVTSSHSILDGFTLTRGYAVEGGGMYLDSSSPTLTHVIISGNEVSAYAYCAGGGMYLSSSSPILTDVTFVGNSTSVCNTSQGAGMYLYASSPTLTSVSFTNNRATGSGGGMFLVSNSHPTLTNVSFTNNEATFSGGGGMYLVSSSPTLVGVHFSGNAAGWGGGGGGMALYGSSPTLTNVSFIGNYTSYTGGGGMYLSSSSPILTNVSFNGNTTDSNGYGGGMLLDGSSPTLTNASFTGNKATGGSYGLGGAIYMRNASSPTLSDASFTGNKADYQGGGWYGGSPKLRNCIAAYNTPDNANSSSPTLSYAILYAPPGQSNYSGFTPSDSTYTFEPGFLAYDASGLPSDLHLALTSPAVNLGDPALSDPDGTRSDIGPFGDSHAAEWDLDGDGFPNYFWPGTLEDAPGAFNPDDYDADDLDPSVL